MSHRTSLSAKTAKAQAEAQAQAQAEQFWATQKKVLEQAAQTVRNAGSRLGHTVTDFANHEVAPRARDAWAHTKPVIDRGVAVTRETAQRAQEKLVNDLIPAVGNAVGTAVTVVELAKSEVVRDAIRNSAASGKKAIAAAGTTVAKEGRKVAKAGRKALKPAGSGGAGKVVLIGFGLVVLGTAAYAAWRTFRAEEDLWAPEADVAPAPSPDEI